MLKKPPPRRRTNPILPFIKRPGELTRTKTLPLGRQVQRLRRQVPRRAHRLRQVRRHRTSSKKCSYGDDGELYVFAVVHQSVPGVETPFIAGIIDLDDGVSVRGNVYGLDPLKPDTELVRQARQDVQRSDRPGPRRQRRRRRQVQSRRTSAAGQGQKENTHARRSSRRREHAQVRALPGQGRRPAGLRGRHRRAQGRRHRASRTSRSWSAATSTSPTPWSASAS